MSCHSDMLPEKAMLTSNVLGRELVVFVELAKDVDVIGGLLQGWIDTGASRCVRVIGVEEHWGKVALTKLAEVKGRVLEGMSDGVTPGGVSDLTSLQCDLN